MHRIRRATRGVSPVIGATLMIAIVVVFSAVAGYVFLGLSDTSDPAPQAVFEAETGDDLADWRLVHGGGDRVDGSNLELRGTASPDAASGRNLSADDGVEFYPTEEEVEVIWYDGDDTSYHLATFEVEQPLPEPDEGCDWVEAESNNGTDDVKIDGVVVNCDVSTDEQVEVLDGGAVVGEVLSGSKDLDLDGGEVYGDVEVQKPANIQNGSVSGSVTSTNREVKLDRGATVDGAVDAYANAEIIGGSHVGGDVQSRTGTTKVDDSAVEGSVTADGKVDLDDATIEGHVYVDSSGFECSSSTINGEDCGEYSPRDPADW